MIEHAHHALLWTLAAALVIGPFVLLILPALCGVTPDRDNHRPEGPRP